MTDTILAGDLPDALDDRRDVATLALDCIDTSL